MAEGSNTNEDFKCGICLSFYTEPRILECYHTFCTPCLEKLISEVSFVICPLCRTEINIPDEGVSALKLYPVCFEKPFGKNEDTFNFCQLCSDENIAICQCIDCQTILCSSCRDYHVKLKSSQTHKFEPLKQIECDVPQIKESDTEICKEHNKPVSLFCKPCNAWICDDCYEKSHRQHDVNTLESVVRAKRNILGPRIAALRSRKSVLEQTTDMVKIEQNNYYKHFDITKKDIQSNASSVKEIFCKFVDFMSQKNIENIDGIKKRDLKTMENFIDELETEHLSLNGLINTSETLLKQYSDRHFLKEYWALGKRLDGALKDKCKSMPSICKIRYEYGKLTEEKMAEIVGQIKTTILEEACKATYKEVLVPPLKATSTTKIHSFKIPEDIVEIVPYENDSVWIRTQSSLLLYRSNGGFISSLKVPKEVKKVLKKSRGEIWLWLGKFARQGNTKDKEGYRVHFEHGIACCFIHNGNIIVFNPNDKMLYEVAEQSGVQRKFNVKDFSLECAEVVMAETKNFNLAFSQQVSTVLVTKPDGEILNKYCKRNAQFNAVVADNYGDIFVTDYKGSLNVFSENGKFQREIINDIPGVNSMTIDECGNLWISVKNQNIKIYTYL